MNRHHVIRSVFVLLFIALVYGLIVDECIVNQIGHPEKITLNKISWHPQMAAEIDVNHFNFEHEFTTQSAVPGALWEEEHISIFVENILDEPEFKFFDFNEPCGKRCFFIIKPIDEGL